MAANQANGRELGKSVLLILWIASTFMFGLLLFTKGFLLTRIELATHATSTNWQRNLGLSETNYQDASLNRTQLNIRVERSNITSNDIPWATFRRAILLIIDGLRHDFISKEKSRADNNFYQSNMLYVKSLVENEKGRSGLFKFIADPPTTTMQRLKALTTGSLPTFIDAGANFASSAILEDNLLYQLKANNKSIVFMGDDTWLDLYPNYFKRVFPFPSFDVKDLDTVDNGVVHHLVPEMKTSDWDVIIAHFLGVDHCGHRYGPNHPEMKRKLLQMDSVIKDVIDNLDNDTLLYVFGDHGMTQNGDHGGDSENETTAGLFVYSKRQIFPTMQESGQLASAVAQVSIVPTLALQMNIPIPFSNVGSIIEDLFAIGKSKVMLDNDSKIAEIDEFMANLNILIALYRNSQQVYDYLMQYSNASQDIPHLTLENLKNSFLESKGKFSSLFNSSLSKGITYSSEDDRREKLSHILESQSDLRNFVRDVYSTCLEVWAKFDLGLMVTGQAVMAVSSLLPYILQIFVSSSEEDELDCETNIFLKGISWRELTGFTLSLMSWMIFTTCYSSMFGVTIIATSLQAISLLCMLPSKISLSVFAKYFNLTSFNIIDFSVIIAMAVYACFLFSNSFMVMEGSLLLFLIQTLLFTWLLWQMNRYLVPKSGQGKDFRQKKYRDQVDYRVIDYVVIIAACLCMRISTVYFSCREEQSGCDVTFLLRPLDAMLYQDSNVKIRQLLSFGSIFIIILSFYHWCKKHGNLVGLSVASVSGKLIVPACGLVIILHWMLQLPAKNKLVDTLDVQWVQQTLFPRFAYAIVVLSITVLFWNPVSAHIVVKNSSSLRGSVTENGLNQNIQLLFNDIRNRLNNDYKSPGQNQIEDGRTIYVFGLHRVYSTAYSTMMTLVLLVVILLLGDGLASSVILMMLVVVCLLFASRSNSERPKEVNQLMIALLSLLSSFWFFAFGHHATIPSIRFDAGFVGFQGDSSSYILQAFLISLNTFSSHAVIALVLPLFHILNTTPILEMESRTQNDNNDSTGEVLLQKYSPRSHRILVKSILSYLGLRMLHVTIMAFVASLHRRHLMVWKIFGPRFIFEVASFLFSLPFLFFGFLFYFRIDKTVQKWMLQLEELRDTLQEGQLQ